MGPRGLEFARYSLDYHIIRNYLYTTRSQGKDTPQIPKFAKMLVAMYNSDGAVDKLLTPQVNKQPFDVLGGVRSPAPESASRSIGAAAAVGGVLLLLLLLLR